MQDLVVPKNIALGIRRLLLDASNQTERLGSFDVKDSDDLIGLLIFPIALFEIGSLESIEDRYREFAIRRAVDGRRGLTPLDTPAKGQANQQAGA